MDQSVKKRVSQPLATLQLGEKARVTRVTGGGGACHDLSFSPEEVERRLLEAGFLEGEEIEILHHGPVGQDPIAVKVNNGIVALRRKEAQAVIVEKTE